MKQVIKVSQENLTEIIRNLVQDESSQNIVSDIVSEIIKNVKERGDQALFEYAKKFDHSSLNKANLLFTEDEINQAYEGISPKLKTSLEIAHQRVIEFHQKQLPQNLFYCDEIGAELGFKWYPLDSVGIYIPGGSANYASSVIMTASLAKVAGIKEIALVMPCRDNQYSKSVLAAAKIVGVNKIYKIGGAQAIAALAFGSESVTKVDKIVGPGNAFVAEAKRQVFGMVGIDSIAGPSEILVIAEGKKFNPKYLATDILSQAEHDQNARCFLVTDNLEFALEVIAEIEALLLELTRQDIARISWEKNGQVFLVDDLKTTGIALSNHIAPEHLELLVEDSDYFIEKLNKAGAIFIGEYSPEAVGDYIAGPSHVLPTSGTARFASGLSIYDFLRKSSLIKFNQDSFLKLSDEIVELANSEGLECHAKSITIRKI